MENKITETKITEINPVILKAMRIDLAEALKQVEEKYGCSLKLGNISYSGNTFHGKLEGAIGSGKDAEKSKWIDDINKGYGLMYNLKVEDYGREITIKNQSYKLVGIKTSARKNPLLVERDGKVYRADESIIK